MQCEETRALLFDYADDRLPEQTRAAVGEHLDTCTICQVDYQGVVDLARQAEVWHDVPAPRWQPPTVARPLDWSGFRQWFPSLASAAALVLALTVYLDRPAATAPAGDDRGFAQALPGLPAPGGATAVPASTSVETLLLNSRLERQQELQALVQLLRAEMDRRNEETQESLRYVIAHQLQGQQEIDDLYQYIRKIGFDGAGSGDRM